MLATDLDRYYLIRKRSIISIHSHGSECFRYTPYRQKAFIQHSIYNNLVPPKSRYAMTTMVAVIAACGHKVGCLLVTSLRAGRREDRGEGTATSLTSQLTLIHVAGGAIKQTKQELDARRGPPFGLGSSLSEHVCRGCNTGIRITATISCTA